MQANLCKTMIAGLALLALAGSPTVQAEPEGKTGGIDLAWDWLPASADAFLDGAVGDMCRGGTYELSAQELFALFPVLAQAQGLSEDVHGMMAADECGSWCTCGACLVIQGQVACAACYACCGEGYVCNSDCKSSIAEQAVTSSCDCSPVGNATAIRTPSQDLKTPEALEPQRGVWEIPLLSVDATVSHLSKAWHLFG